MKNRNFFVDHIHSSDCQPVLPTFGDVVSGHVAAGDVNDDGKVSRIVICDRAPHGITDDVNSATSSQDAWLCNGRTLNEKGHCIASGDDDVIGNVAIVV